MINKLIGISAPYAFAIIAAAFLALIIWAVFIYGPAQHEAGGAQTAITLDKATKEAANDLSNKAEAARLLLRSCDISGGLYDFENGKCQR